MDTITVKNVVDVLIIGLGPAGIMATHRLHECGINVLAVDRGKPYTSRESLIPYDVANGFGGAGLFSDGKLSFFPAASNLWANFEEVNLKKSYNYVQSLLTPLGYRFPKWQNRWTKHKANKQPVKKVKRYQTTYFSERARMLFVKNMYKRIQSVTMLNTEVVRINKRDGMYHVFIQQGIGDVSSVVTRRIILATGKAGNVIFDDFEGAKFQFTVRFEGGIRVETNSLNFKPFDLKQIDYKYIEQIGNLEIRTFCSCKDGNVLQSNYIRNISYNGSITPFPTGRSNIGLTIRSDRQDCEIAQELISCVKRYDSFVFDYGENYDNKQKFWIGIEFDKLLSEKLSIVLKSYKTKYKTKIYGPEIEYFGKYPIFDWSQLKAENENVWIIGDLSCKYRGIVAALISGVYAANEIVGDMAGVKHDYV